MPISHAPKAKNPNAKKKPAVSATSLATINKTAPGKLTPAQKSRVAQLIGNAASRHLLDERFLTPALRQRRHVNAELAQPVVEGSTVTNREMAQQRKVAEGLRYGGQEAALKQDVATRQQMAKDTGGFYDQYLAELRQHQAATQQINAQAVGQQQALTGAVGAIQAPAPAPAVVGATPDAQVPVDANNATALRQALGASFGAMFAQQGAARNQYADTLSHVVGPTQKLSGQVQAAGNVELARKALIQEAAEKGLFGQQFEQQFKAQESQNVSEAQKQKLAADIAGVKLDQSQQGLDIQEQNAQTQRGNQRIAARALGVNAKAKEASSPEGKEAAKYGRSLHDWRLLGPKGRQRVKNQQARADVRNYRRKHPTAKKGPDVITSGAFSGYTKDQVAKMPAADKERLKNDYNKVVHPGAKAKATDPTTGPGYKAQFRRKYGVDPLGTPAINKAKTSISQAQTWINNIKKSPDSKNMSLGQIGQLLTSGQSASKDSAAIPKMDPLMVRVAMDIKQYGFITPGTADRLHRAGYSTKTLGVKTGKPKPRRPSTTGTSAGSAVGTALGRP